MTGDTGHPRLLQDLPRSLDEEQIGGLLRTPSLRKDLTEVGAREGMLQEPRTRG
jgi:hypothetical protein